MKKADTCTEILSKSTISKARPSAVSIIPEEDTSTWVPSRCPESQGCEVSSRSPISQPGVKGVSVPYLSRLRDGQWCRCASISTCSLYQHGNAWNSLWSAKTKQKKSSKLWYEMKWRGQRGIRSWLLSPRQVLVGDLIHVASRRAWSTRVIFSRPRVCVARALNPTNFSSPFPASCHRVLRALVFSSKPKTRN